jgi:hypothetical protein
MRGKIHRQSTVPWDFSNVFMYIYFKIMRFFVIVLR